MGYGHRYYSNAKRLKAVKGYMYQNTVSKPTYISPMLSEFFNFDIDNEIVSPLVRQIV